MPTLPPRPRIAPGPSRHVYDVLVLGAELGGALAAAVLAKRGLRVLWAEHAQLQPGYEHEGFLFATPPFFVPPFRNWPAVENLFTELGLTTGFQRQLKPAGPMQVILPRHRLELPDGRDTAPGRAAAGVRQGRSDGVAESLATLTAGPEASDPFFRFLDHFAPARLAGAVPPPPPGEPGPRADPGLAALGRRAGGGAAQLRPPLPGAARSRLDRWPPPGCWDSC